jgi:predicted RNase H-like HicB family nuclease
LVPRYIALVDGKAGAYGASFPDAPGATAMAATIDDVLRLGGEALAEWIADEVAAGRGPPEPRSMEQLRGDPDVSPALASGAMLAVVPVVIDYGRPTRINISLDAGLLAAIDEAAAERRLTRSAYLSTAAREKIAAG